MNQFESFESALGGFIDKAQTKNTTEIVLSLFERICLCAEKIVNEHLELLSRVREDARQGLFITSITQKISANITELPPHEISLIVSIYLRNRDDIEIIQGKNGGVYPKNTIRKITNKNDYRKTTHYLEIKELGCKLIDGYLNNIPKIQIKDICHEISKSVEVKDYIIYQCLKSYIRYERPDLKVTVGKYGGITKSNV